MEMMWHPYQPLAQMIVRRNARITRIVDFGLTVKKRTLEVKIVG